MDSRPGSSILTGDRFLGIRRMLDLLKRPSDSRWTLVSGTTVPLKSDPSETRSLGRSLWYDWRLDLLTLHYLRTTKCKHHKQYVVIFTYVNNRKILLPSPHPPPYVTLYVPSYHTNQPPNSVPSPSFFLPPRIRVKGRQRDLRLMDGSQYRSKGGEIRELTKSPFIDRLLLVKNEIY